MLQVDDAYNISARTIERLRPFNEDANSKRAGATNLTKAEVAYDKCKESFKREVETRLSEQKKSPSRSSCC